MSTGNKESREIVQFVVALANVLASVGGEPSVTTVLGNLGGFVSSLRLAGPAINGASLALLEASDGYSEQEKAELSTDIEKLELPSDAVEKVAEKVLKAGVALTDLVQVVNEIRAAAKAEASA